MGSPLGLCSVAISEPGHIWPMLLIESLQCLDRGMRLVTERVLCRNYRLPHLSPCHNMPGTGPVRSMAEAVGVITSILLKKEWNQDSEKSSKVP